VAAVGRGWVAGVVATIVLTLAACSDADPLRSAGGGNHDPNSVVVGSANFPESETVADIYAAALGANGFSVSTHLDIGSREAYIPALRGGSIDLIPDYTGNLLQYLKPGAAQTGSSEVTAALRAALGTTLAIGTPAPGQDSDAVVVSRATAERWHLTSIADLAQHSGDVRFGASAEFQDRPDGLPGLKRNYGLDISAGNFVPIADGGGPATVKALASGQITAADIFTTSPAIKANGLVVLTDPKRNFAAQNLVPVLNIAKRAGKLLSVLDAVSAELTTQTLTALNESVSGPSKTEPDEAAAQWLAAHGLNRPIGG
jgi:osmoprotectant transport system substrate-binding protein